MRFGIQVSTEAQPREDEALEDRNTLDREREMARRASNSRGSRDGQHLGSWEPGSAVSGEGDESINDDV